MGVYRRMYGFHRWLDGHPALKLAVALLAGPAVVLAATAGGSVMADLALIVFVATRAWCVTFDGPDPG